MTALLDTLLDIAGAAAQIIREVYDTDFAVEFKGPKDPVTSADRRANTLICDRLEAAFPGVPIVAEESDPSSFSDFRRHERVFFVDPLDGTSEFVDRNGEFVVMIGLLEGDDAVAGVVAAPATGVAWAGAVGQGAFAVTPDGARTPIAVSPAERIGDARIVSSRSHRGPLLERALRRSGAREVVALGSAGLKGAHVAAGLAELYIAPGHSGKRWDACAVDALVTAAGGRFTDGFGQRFDYRASSLTNDRGMIASNARLHQDVVALFEALREENR